MAPPKNQVNTSRLIRQNDKGAITLHTRKSINCLQMTIIQLHQHPRPRETTISSAIDHVTDSSSANRNPNKINLYIFTPAIHTCHRYVQDRRGPHDLFAIVRRSEKGLRSTTIVSRNLKTIHTVAITSSIREIPINICRQKQTTVVFPADTEGFTREFPTGWYSELAEIEFYRRPVRSFPAYLRSTEIPEHYEA